MCISGITTLRLSLPHCQNGRGKTRGWAYWVFIFQMRHNKQNNDPWRNNLPLGFYQALRCTSLTLNSFLYMYRTNNYKMPWWISTNSTINSLVLDAKSHKHIKHMKLMALSSKKFSNQWSYRDHSTCSKISNNTVNVHWGTDKVRIR